MSPKPGDFPTASSAATSIARNNHKLAASSPNTRHTVERPVIRMLSAQPQAARYAGSLRTGRRCPGGLLPPEPAVDDVQPVCFTGENADILQGIATDGTDRRSKSFTGFLAYHLGGEAAYDALLMRSYGTR